MCCSGASCLSLTSYAKTLTQKCRVDVIVQSMAGGTIVVTAVTCCIHGCEAKANKMHYDLEKTSKFFHGISA